MAYSARAHIVATKGNSGFRHITGVPGFPLNDYDPEKLILGVGSNVDDWPDVQNRDNLTSPTGLTGATLRSGGPGAKKYVEFATATHHLTKDRSTQWFSSDDVMFAVVFRIPSDSDADKAMAVWTQSTPTNNFMARLTGAGGAASDETYFLNRTSAGASDNVNTGPHSDDEWHVLIVKTHAGNLVELYLDGASVTASKTLSTDIIFSNSTTQRLILGSRSHQGADLSEAWDLARLLTYDNHQVTVNALYTYLRNLYSL